MLCTTYHIAVSTLFIAEIALGFVMLHHSLLQQRAAAAATPQLTALKVASITA